MNLEGLKRENISGRPQDIKNGCVVAVGSFDGVHLGHQKLISVLCELGREYNAHTAVFTFDVSDNPKSQTNRLATKNQKNSLLGIAGVELLVSAPFSKYKDMEAEDFISEILLGYMQARAVVCGYDFRFGRGRKGDGELLRNILTPLGIPVITAPVCYFESAPISSTAIRGLIANGEMKSASKLLGRNYSFSGKVIKGRQLGRNLGFPTANLQFPAELCLPPLGVYAVKCSIDGKNHGGVANLGVKPTIGQDVTPLCETNIFGFEGDIYGKEITVEFLEFIRKEQRFDSLDDLKKQIEIDSSFARSIIEQGELI